MSYYESEDGGPRKHRRSYEHQVRYEKRPRYHEPGMNEAPLQDPCTALCRSIFELGDKEGPFEMVRDGILSDYDKYKAEIHTGFVDCISTCSWKTRSYPTLVGLLNVKHPDMVKELFALLVYELSSFLRTGQWAKSALVLDFLADCVQLNLLRTEDWFVFLQTLVEALSETQSVTSASVQDQIALVLFGSLVYVSRQ